MKHSLPDSASDLLIKDGKLLMKSLSIYEILRRFGHIIRLAPFRFEDFTAALLAQDQSALLAEIHVQILRTLVRDDRQQQTWLGPPDIRDAVTIYLHLADHSNWPAALRIYLSADPITNSETLTHLTSDEIKCYPFSVNLETRLEVLEHLCYQFLSTATAREEIVNGVGCAITGDKPENGDSGGDQKQDSDLTYDISNLKRHEDLGIDKLGRRYWLLVRRLFVVDETEDDVRYYTTVKQLGELYETLNENRHDQDLIDNLNEQREEIERQMKITEDLYSTLLKDHKRDDGTYSISLGQDGTHRNYVNQYSSNNVALTKNQISLERDITRSLSNKFCMTSVNSFKWFGAIDGHLHTLTVTLRTTIFKLEAMLPPTFLHPCWSQARPIWYKSLNYSTDPRIYAIALSKLESALKPVLFKSAWTDTVGFTQLFRSTFSEREELKKTDRQPRGFERRECVTADFELSYRNGTMVKFSSKLKPVKHQVWKQKGEEYRLTGLNGWFWQSKTRKSWAKASKRDWPKPKLEPFEQPVNGENGGGDDQTEAPEFKLVGPDKGFKWSDAPKKKEQANLNKCVMAKPKLLPCHDFQTRRGRIRSIFVLPQIELRKLARSAGMREARSFSYTAKQNAYIWPYGMTPRPTFRTCWLYRNQLINTIQDVALQLKVFFATIRWDELQTRPPASGKNVIVTDENTVTIELLKKRDRLPYLSHSEYLIRKVTTPNEVLEKSTKYRKNASKKNATPSKVSTPTSSGRSGLRARRQADEEEEKGPTTEEIWVPEEQLELWELKQFDEKLERQKALMRERALREEAEKRRKVEEERRRAAEAERRRIRNEEEAKRARLSSTAGSTPATPNSNNTSSTNFSTTPKQNNSINIPSHQQRSQPATPVLRYFRTEQGQIIRLPASYLQRGTPLILRHVSPGTNQTNTYIIRPQITAPTTTPLTPTGPVALRMVTPAQENQKKPGDDTANAAITTTATTATTTTTTTTTTDTTTNTTNATATTTTTATKQPTENGAT